MKYGILCILVDAVESKSYAMKNSTNMYGPYRVQKNPYNDFKLIYLFFIDTRCVVVNASHSGTRNK